jgi:hypothetical protein
MNEWLLREQEYMAVLLDFDALGDDDICARCKESSLELYRCSTCQGKANYCRNCTVQLHRDMPLHRVSVWDHVEGCFMVTSLNKIGLILHLGCHTQHAPCPHPDSTQNLTIIHTNGIHNLTVQYCSCSLTMARDLQVFSSRLFPASQQSPQTAFSFEVLDQFRHHHFEGKTSAYTFMNALYRLTDDTGGVEVEVRILGKLSENTNMDRQDRVREFRRVSREWNYLLSRRFSGQYGTSSPLPLAIICPACPHPGKNITHDWFNTLPLEQQSVILYSYP